MFSGQDKDFPFSAAWDPILSRPQRSLYALYSATSFTNHGHLSAFQPSCQILCFWEVLLALQPHHWLSAPRETSLCLAALPPVFGGSLQDSLKAQSTLEEFLSALYSSCSLACGADLRTKGDISQLSCIWVSTHMHLVTATGKHESVSAHLLCRWGSLPTHSH